MRVVAWRAWYTEGRRFIGHSLEDWDTLLPDDGVLTVMLFFDDGTRRVEQGDDYYWAAPAADGGVIYAHGSRESAEEIAERYPGASIKRGKWTTDGEMHRVADEAMAAEAP